MLRKTKSLLHGIAPRTRAAFACAAILSMGSGPGAAQTILYLSPSGSDLNSGTTAASPWKTLEKARDYIRTNKLNQDMQSDVIVQLAGGVYSLTKPFSLTEADSGSNGHSVVYQASGAGSPILSGGRAVTRWALHDKARNIWKATLSDSFESRQLYVNGVRAVRARSVGAIQAGLPGCGFDDSAVKTTDTSMLRWQNLSDVELVWHQWFSNPRCGIDSAVRAGDTVHLYMKQPGYMWCRNKGGSSVQKPWYVENAYELLDQPGEWYLDRTGAIGGVKRTLYYMPRAGENLATADVQIPVLGQLVVAKGTGIDKPLHHVGFKGITFAYSTWNEPGTRLAHPDAQNNITRRNKPALGLSGESVPPGALDFDFATDIAIQSCRLQHLGSNGIVFRNAPQRVLVDHDTLTDISGGGIHLGLVDRGNVNNYLPTDPRWEQRDNVVSNCSVYRIGLEYRSATAISAAYPIHMAIRNNEAYSLPYSGIHLGWGWIQGPSCIRDNWIDRNRLYGTMQQMWDGMPIYTLGMNSGSPDSLSFIAGNYVNGAVYNDEGSSWYVTKKNVIFNGTGVFIQWVNAPPHDNLADSNYVQTDKYTDFQGRNKVTNTFVISTSYALMPLAARLIVDSAGPRPLEPTTTEIEHRGFSEQGKGPFDVRIYALDGRLAAGFRSATVPDERSLQGLSGIRSTGIYRVVVHREGGAVSARSILLHP